MTEQLCYSVYCLLYFGAFIPLMLFLAKAMHIIGTDAIDIWCLIGWIMFADASMNYNLHPTTPKD